MNQSFWWFCTIHLTRELVVELILLIFIAKWFHDIMNPYVCTKLNPSYEKNFVISKPFQASQIVKLKSQAGS